MGIVYFYIWMTSFVEPLHPNAFRDITLNFTPLFIIIALIVWFKKRNEEKRKTNANKED